MNRAPLSLVKISFQTHKLSYLTKPSQQGKIWKLLVIEKKLHFLKQLSPHYLHFCKLNNPNDLSVLNTLFSSCLFEVLSQIFHILLQLWRSTASLPKDRGIIAPHLDNSSEDEFLKNPVLTHNKLMIFYQFLLYKILVLMSSQ